MLRYAVVISVVNCINTIFDTIFNAQGLFSSWFLPYDKEEELVLAADKLNAPIPVTAPLECVGCKGSLAITIPLKVMHNI